MFTADQKKTGILASVSLAQFILESGYGKSELAQSSAACVWHEVLPLRQYLGRLRLGRDE